MKTKLTQIILLLVLSAVASAQGHYKAIRISTFPSQTIGLAQIGPYVLANAESGVTLAALNANSNGYYAGQDIYYNVWEGTAAGITNLAPLVGSYAQIWAINDNGTMVGYSEAGIYSDDYQAFVIEGGVVTRIPTLGGLSDTAQAVSTNNLVAGHSMKADGIIYAIFWNGSTVTDLGSFGGTYYSSSNPARTFASDAWGVNSLGEVVGSSWMTNGEQRAFLWSGGIMYNLHTLGGTFSSAAAINDSGVVVGTAALANGIRHGFVHENSTMYDLNNLISGLPSGVYINATSQINNSGQILATGSDGGTYLLSPF